MLGQTASAALLGLICQYRANQLHFIKFTIPVSCVPPSGRPAFLRSQYPAPFLQLPVALTLPGLPKGCPVAVVSHVAEA